MQQKCLFLVRFLSGDLGTRVAVGLETTFMTHLGECVSASAG